MEKYFSHFDDKIYIQQMYYYRTKAYMIVRMNGDNNEALEFIKKAINITMPNWKEDVLSNYLISTYEMENLLVYGLILHNLGMDREAEKHISMCHEYIKAHFSDKEEYRKIYSKCVWLMAKIYKDETEDIKIISLCEEALMNLREGAISYFMVPLMQEVISRYQKLGAEKKVEYWQRFHKILVELYEEYAQDMSLDSLFFNPYQCEYHLDYEIIKGERLAKGYTQEELIEGVYASAEPLSRVENGHVSPQKGKFDALMEKFNIEKGKYNALIATNSFKVLELKSGLEHHLAVYDIEEAGKQLEDLKSNLDMSLADNRRFVESIKNTIDRLQGSIDNGEALEKARVLLRETYDLEKENNRPPMRNEAVLIVQIATIMNILDMHDEAIKMLEKVLLRYDRSKVANKYRIRSHMLVCGNYERYLYDKGNNIESIRYTQARLGNELRIGKGRVLEQGCLIVACNKIDMKNDECECRKELKRAYFIGELFLQELACERIYDYYINIFGCSIE